MNSQFIFADNLNSSIPLFDNHVHTTFSDGRSTVEEFIEAALEQGIRSLVFTDHVNREAEWFWDYVAEIKRMRQKYATKINLSIGLEAKTIDYQGSIDATDGMINACDVVMGVVHGYPDGLGKLLNPPDVDSSLGLELEYRAAKGLLENGKIHVLGHMGATFEKRYSQRFPDHLTKQLIEIARQKNKAIEINGKYHKEIPKLVRFCREAGSIISLGSDAHDATELGMINRRLKAMRII